VEELARTAALVQQVMAEAYALRVPLQTEARYGQNWGQMNPVSQMKG
jgi:DNA polymerase I-like protein with 3'-5' exonuclease and polymerase domains